MEWQLEYDYRTLETLGVTVNDIRNAVTSYYSTEYIGMAEVEVPESAHSWTRITLASPNLEDGIDPQLSLLPIGMEHL